MNCKVNRLQAIMLFQCSSHAHHSAQRLSIMSQHTPTNHLHWSDPHSALGATQLQTSVRHHTAQQTVLTCNACRSLPVMSRGDVSSYLGWAMPYQELWHHVTLRCHHFMARDTTIEHNGMLCCVMLQLSSCALSCYILSCHTCLNI